MRLSACLAWVLGLTVLALGTAAAGELSPAETDQAVNVVFDTARRITHLEAGLTTVKKGGTFGATEIVSHGLLRLATPNLMWLQDFGDENGVPRQSDPGLQQCSITLVDGKFIWDIQAPVNPGSPSTADRMQLADSVANGQATNIAGLLGLFMGLGADITGAAQIRETFRITCVQEPLNAQDGRAPYSNHFTLTPLDPDNRTVLGIWHRPGDALPWQVQSTEVKVVQFGRNKGKEQQEITTRVLSRTRTNLDGLPAFPANAFQIPQNLRVEIE